MKTIRLFTTVILVFALLIIAIPTNSLAAIVVGDFNNDGKVKIDDAIYLLYNLAFPDDFKITQSGDMNSDGSKTIADAIHLLYNISFPADFPLPTPPVEDDLWSGNY